MKRKLMQLSVCCALGVLSFQAVGGEGPGMAGHQRDCSKIADAKKKARCEEVNKAMSACEGKKAGDVADCVKHEHAKNN